MRQWLACWPAKRHVAGADNFTQALDVGWNLNWLCLGRVWLGPKGMVLLLASANLVASLAHGDEAH